MIPEQMYMKRPMKWIGNGFHSSLKSSGKNVASCFLTNDPFEGLNGFPHIPWQEPMFVWCQWRWKIRKKSDSGTSLTSTHLDALHARADTQPENCIMVQLTWRSSWRTPWQHCTGNFSGGNQPRTGLRSKTLVCSAPSLTIYTIRPIISCPEPCNVTTELDVIARSNNALSLDPGNDIASRTGIMFIWDRMVGRKFSNVGS